MNFKQLLSLKSFIRICDLKATTLQIIHNTLGSEEVMKQYKKKKLIILSTEMLFHLHY